MKVLWAAGTLAALGAGGLFAWEYTTRDQDAVGRMEHVRAIVQSHGDRILARHGLTRPPAEVPAERCAWRRHCGADLVASLQFRPTGETAALLQGSVDLKDGSITLEGKRIQLQPDYSGSTLAWRCTSDLPERVRPSGCVAI